MQKHVKATTPFVMKTEMHTAKPICMKHTLSHTARNGRAIYMMTTHKFGHVIGICVSTIKAMMVLTLYLSMWLPYVLNTFIFQRSFQKFHHCAHFGISIENAPKWVQTCLSEIACDIFINTRSCFHLAMLSVSVFPP